MCAKYECKISFIKNLHAQFAFKATKIEMKKQTNGENGMR